MVYKENGLENYFSKLGLNHRLKLPSDFKGPLFFDENFINSDLFVKIQLHIGTNKFRPHQLYSPAFISNHSKNEYLPQSEGISRASRIGTFFMSDIVSLEELVEERRKGRDTTFPVIIFGSRAENFYSLTSKNYKNGRVPRESRLRNCGPRGIRYTGSPSQTIWN